ncbi:hypothetical protein CPB84DRAFT_1744776 [Gymnopilus junonius]|uniref:Uncharacterized protein n=1 Tax=Gymnopilus junonius TaxID=109634 RepID=A0A9P5NUD8_GYMJU|nr:hypothetical protein CPB84DRAFT_1744776 [Gymnopilus junonius]
MNDSTPPLNLVLHTPDGDEPWVINQKIFDILIASLQSVTALSATDTAKAIDQLFPLNRPRDGDKENEEPASFLFEMWGVVIDVAQQLPWKDTRQDRLVDIIRALKDLPESKAIQMNSWGELEVWADLPLLGPVMTETCYGINLDDTSFKQKIIRARQQNFVAFAARLTKSNLADRAHHHAIQDFREALEEEPDPRARAYLQQGPRLDTYVPLAAAWTLFAGGIVFAHCRVSGSGDNTDVRDRTSRDGGKNWKGANGFSVERWNFWKKRFGEIKGHNQASEETRGLAAEAQGAMRRIETEVLDVR